MTTKVFLTLGGLLLAITPALAQGLVAFPWKVCPEVPLARDPNKTEPRCVWVTDARRPSVLRPREVIEGNFSIDVLNPGDGPADIAIQVRTRGGSFVREISDAIPAGVTRQYGPAIVPLEGWLANAGIWIISSDRPLLLWAWHIEQHLVGREAALNRPPEAMSTAHVPIIPVDCSDATTENFAWICAAAQGPPPPN